jgi:hypothetical protein
VLDRRICFIGDSYVAGARDPEMLGWAGRVAAAAVADGMPMTFYNLVATATLADGHHRVRMPRCIYVN